MAGEMTPDDGYALLQNAGPEMGMLRAALLARSGQSKRNIAAMGKPDPTVRTLPPERMAALMGANSRPQPYAPAPDPYADTPQDTARKAALSAMAIKGGGAGHSGEISGGTPDARAALQSRFNDPAMLAPRKAQSDTARYIRDTGKSTRKPATTEAQRVDSGRETMRQRRLQEANDAMAPLIALAQAQHGGPRPEQLAQANYHNSLAEAIRAQHAAQQGAIPGQPAPGSAPQIPGQPPLTAPPGGGITIRPPALWERYMESGTPPRPRPDARGGF